MAADLRAVLGALQNGHRRRARGRALLRTSPIARPATFADETGGDDEWTETIGDAPRRTDGRRDIDAPAA